MSDEQWIAADWGTSNLRVWSMRGRDVLAQASSDAGMNGLERSGFEGALLTLVADWIDGPVNVMACGMVGSRQGWAEASYQPVPCIPAAKTVLAPTTDPRLKVRILSGVCQVEPPDVMRGEETQIAGFLFENPDFDGVICLPGTHTKWARVSAGELCHFRTAMTGELFQLISERSVLRHSITTGWDEEAFATAFDETLSRPERLATSLFSLRASGLLKGENGPHARARLSGTLLGAELAAMKPYWLGQDVALVGAPKLNDIYSTALATVGLSPRAYDGTRMVLAGLTAAQEAI